MLYEKKWIKLVAFGCCRSNSCWLLTTSSISSVRKGKLSTISMAVSIPVMTGPQSIWILYFFLSFFWINRLFFKSKILENFFRNKWFTRLPSDSVVTLIRFISLSAGHKHQTTLSYKILVRGRMITDCSISFSFTSVSLNGPSQKWLMIKRGWSFCDFGRTSPTNHQRHLKSASSVLDGGRYFTTILISV